MNLSSLHFFCALAAFCAFTSERYAVEDVARVGIIGAVFILMRLFRKTDHSVNQLRVWYSGVFPQIKGKAAGDCIDLSNVGVLTLPVIHIINPHNALAVKHPEYITTHFLNPVFQFIINRRRKNPVQAGHALASA